MEPAQYDVALSFLATDQPIAAALFDRLSEGLHVFFFPRNQEELAGTDGMESMRTPFLDDSRVVVVLYREPWGQTPWTRVEQTAIQDGCLKHGWHRLIFVTLDETNTLPKWLPMTHVRLNYAEYGLEQTIGAIKNRVQEAGGVLAPLTPAKRAEQYRLEADYARDRSKLRSPDSNQIVSQYVAELFEAVQRLCAEVTVAQNIPVECSKDALQCHLRSRASLVVSLRCSYSACELMVREFDKRLPMGNEQHLYYPDGDPKVLRESKYLPDLNRAREFGWTEYEGAPFLSSSSLADRIVIQFIDLLDKVNRRGGRGALFSA